MHFSDKAPCSFIAKFLILNTISILPPLRKARICFRIKVGAQKPVRGPETTDNDRKVNHVSYEYETDTGSGLSGPGWPLPRSYRLLPPLAQALGTQTCALFILPLAPRAQAFKYADKWMDIAMQIVSSLLRNVPENHIFPSFPSGILNTQNQVNVSIYAEVCKYSTM